MDVVSRGVVLPSVCMWRNSSIDSAVSRILVVCIVDGVSSEGSRCH